MGQRHNRRRTRPGSRNRSINIIPVEPAPRPVTSDPALSRRTSAACDSRDAIAIHPAPTWHTGCLTWPKRERTPRFESARLDADQYRLFGGEPGDDVGLCYRMLEYFDGLDYINPSQCLTPLPG